VYSPTKLFNRLLLICVLLLIQVIHCQAQRLYTEKETLQFPGYVFIENVMKANPDSVIRFYWASSDSLEKLPDELLRLKNLQNLHIPPFKKLHRINLNFGHFQYLQYLNIRYSSIKEISNEISDAPNLKKLELEGNKISRLPNNILVHAKLEELSVKAQKVDTFYLPSVVNNTKLKILNVGKNPIFKIPNNFFNFKSLTHLYLNESNIKIIPENIVNLNTLKYLDFSGNPIDSLPENIGEMQNLNVLILSNTNLKELPESFFSLKNLAYLDLRNTKIIGDSLDEKIKLFEKFDGMNKFLRVMW